MTQQINPIPTELKAILNDVVDTVSNAVNQEMIQRGWNPTPEFIRDYCHKDHDIRHAESKSTIVDTFYYKGLPFFKAITTLTFSGKQVVVSHEYQSLNNRQTDDRAN